MSEKYLFAYLGTIFPYEFDLWQYKNITYKLCEGIGQTTRNSVFESLVKDDILLIDDNKVKVYPDKKDKIYAEFKSINEYKNKFYTDKIYQEIENVFRPSKWKTIVDVYFYFVKHSSCDISLSTSVYQLRNFEKAIYGLLDQNNIYDIIKIFSSPLISDNVRIELIALLYKYNQNKCAIYLYENIKDIEIIQPDALIKIASAYFMSACPEDAQNIINKIKTSYPTDINIQTTIKALELINEYESDNGNIKRESLINDFSKMVNDIEKTPNCANLLLKISSSILSHEDAISFMIRSNLNYHTTQIYNNIGALYLIEGYKKFIKNPKDKDYLIKSEKYLQFAKMIGDEKEEYFPYLLLNMQTLRFCNNFRKKSKKHYSAIYKNYLNLLGKADSIYFNSIIYCNCYILEKLTTNKDDKLEEYHSMLMMIYEKTRDFKIKEKITAFLNFSIEDKSLPLWIITETHY